MIITFALLSLCAPAPLPRPRPVQEVTPGDYVLHWDASRFHAHLNAARGYQIPPTWWGTWRWDPRTRTLVIQEWSESSYMEWTAVLDRNLVGTATYGNSSPAVWLERKEKP